MSKTRLEVLKEGLTEFAPELGALDRLIEVDTGSSLNKIRFILEKVLKRLCRNKGVDYGEDTPHLGALIGLLVGRSLLPKHVAVHARAIMEYSNLGSHHQEFAVSRAHLDIASAALVDLLWWYYRQQPGGRSLDEDQLEDRESQAARRIVPIVEPGGAGQLRVGDVEDVRRWGWDGVRLLDEFIRIDYETLDALDGASEGHSRQWAPIFMNHPDTWRMMLTAADEIAGYWHFAPLFRADYELAINGELLDSELTIDRVLFFELPGVYDLYFCQICLLPRFRNACNIRTLLGSVFAVIERLSLDEVYFSRVAANAYTLEGHALCKTFNLTYIRQHRHSGAIYEAPIGNILGNPLASRFKVLRDRYAQHGLA